MIAETLAPWAEAMAFVEVHGDRWRYRLLVRLRGAAAGSYGRLEKQWLAIAVVLREYDQARLH